MSRAERGPQYDDHNEVHMGAYDFSEGSILLYTDGLGPCIGACIAWKAWAGIVHLGSEDENVLHEFVAKAKEALPLDVVGNISPIICGADPGFDVPNSDDPDDPVTSVLKLRDVVKEVLEEAGFGHSEVHWNEPGQTVNLVAYLKHGVVCVETDMGEIEYPILGLAGVASSDE